MREIRQFRTPPEPLVEDELPPAADVETEEADEPDDDVEDEVEPEPDSIEHQL